MKEKPIHTIVHISQLQDFLESSEFKEREMPVGVFFASDLHNIQELMEKFSSLFKVEECTYLSDGDVLFQWEEIDWDTMAFPKVEIPTFQPDNFFTF